MVKGRGAQGGRGRDAGLPASVKALAVVAVAGAVAGAYYLATTVSCARRDLGAMEQHLEGRGTVVYVGPASLGALDAPRCTLVPAERHREVVEALEGRDEAALVEALETAGARSILVAASETDPQLMPEPTLGELLSNYQALERFHGVYISQAAALFEVTEPVTLSDEAGAQLVAAARAVLRGDSPPDRGELSAEVTRERSGAEVSVLIQGLRPLPQPNVRTSNFVRRDYYVSRAGDSLLEATVAAAERLRERWDETGNQGREGPLGEALDRLWVEVEVFYDRTPVEMQRGALPAKVYERFLWQAIELGVHGLYGHFEGQRDIFLLPSAAVYWARPDVPSYLERLARKFDLNGDSREDNADGELYDETPGFHLERFRTFHFREMSPGGEVRRLTRSFVSVGDDAVSREGLREEIRLASTWLVENIQDDGLFEYKYYPTRDIYYREFHGDDDEEAHNIVRHALASYGLFMVYRELRDERIWEAAERSLQVLLDNTAIGPAWYEDAARRARLPDDQRRTCTESASCGGGRECIDGYCRLPFGAPVPSEGSTLRVAPGDVWESHDGYRRAIAPDMMFVRWNDVGKMGAAAATVMALTEAIAARPELLEVYRPYLEGYAAFFLFMRRPDGSFNHYFTAPGDVRYYNTETSIYPGEILFALARINRLMPREDLVAAFESGHEHYASWFRSEVGRRNSDGTYDEMRRNDLVAFAPWMSMADREFFDQHPDRRAVAEFGVEASDWLAQQYQYDHRRTYYPAYLGSYYRVWWEQPAMHGIVYTEGSAAAFDLARRIGDREAADRLREATRLGCRFAIQQTIRPGIDDHYFPGSRARVRAAGGVRFSLTVADLRTDYTYHALSALVQTLRYFRDEDWPEAARSSEPAPAPEPPPAPSADASPAEGAPPDAATDVGPD